MNPFITRLNYFDTKIAIIHNGVAFTYKELYEKIQTIKKELLVSIDSKDVASIVSDYSFESIALFLALYENKNIIVPITTNIEESINSMFEESFTNKIIYITDAQYIIKSRDVQHHTMIQNLQKTDNAGLILFSSGTTSKPKAMVHNLDNLIDHHLDKKEKSINMLLFLMFDHIGGINTLLNILSIGATMIIPSTRNADDVCRLIEEYKIKILPYSPTFLNLILMSQADKKYDLSSLRLITYGTESMPESLLKRLKERFSKTKFLQTFGTSETGIANTVSKSSNSTYMKIVDEDLEYKIVDNELWLKSKTQVLGYLNASMEQFTDDEWFKTGDLVEFTEDGYIKIIGRNKELINVGGEKVLPNEVESVILEIDGIEDVIVYAQPNAITGQSVVCDVVLTQEIEKKALKKLLRKHCLSKLASYKVPTKVNTLESLDFNDRFKKIRKR